MFQGYLYKLNLLNLKMPPDGSLKSQFSEGCLSTSEHCCGCKNCWFIPFNWVEKQNRLKRIQVTVITVVRLDVTKQIKLQSIIY